jgi:hypothetical protein
LLARPEGGSLTVPGPGSAPEEIAAFWERLGVPGEAAGYTFAKDDPELAGAFHAAGLTEAQARAVYDADLAAADAVRKERAEALARDFQATDAVMRGEYGERYEEALAFMRRGLGNDPATGEPSPIARALAEAGLAGKPEICRAFAELGRSVSESGPAPAGGAPGDRSSVLGGRGFGYA